MSFKEKYSEYQRDIVPDKEFLDKLAEKMERQKKAARQRKRVLFISTASVCAAAAAAAVVIFNVSGADKRLNVKIGESSINVSTGVFVNKTVFNEDRPLPEQLSEMIEKSASAVYKSSENKFDDSGELNAEQRAELAEKIKSAKDTDAQISEKAEHYMLVLENGDVIKFIISGDILQADGKFFKIL